MQLRTTPQHASCRPAVTDPAGHVDAAADPDACFTIVAGICAQALRRNRGYLELIEAINRLDASPR